MTNTTKAPFNRATGVLVIEVRHSNPNGDPDAESDPRTLDVDGRGLISPVSFKRKLRDLIGDGTTEIWQETVRTLGLEIAPTGRQYEILESRGRDRIKINAMNAQVFSDTYWDGRVFGNTFLEAAPKETNKETGEDGGEKKSTKRTDKAEKIDKSHFISTGVVQFGAGISVAPIEIDRLTTTNKAGVEGDKDRGMAPLGWRVVRHAVYAMPFFVNPMMAQKSGCNATDLDVLKFLIPHAYRNTASAMRPFVEVRHAWYAEHTSPLGSCRDSMILDALTPKKIRGGANEPSADIGDYDIPTALPPEVMQRLASFTDLCDAPVLR